MDFSDVNPGGTITVAQDETVRRLTPTTAQHSCEIRDVHLDLKLSRETLSRMSEVEQRTLRVFTTSTRFAFR